MSFQLFASFMDEVSGPLLPLVTAAIAAVVAFRIAAFNARRSTERETVAELRIAYAKWCDAIHEIATIVREGIALENLGWHRNPSHENVTDDAQQHVHSISKVTQAASRIRVLDSALPPEFDLIIGVLDTEEWNPMLGEKPEHEHLVVSASRCAEKLMERVAGRLNSDKPFRADHLRVQKFEF